MNNLSTAPFRDALDIVFANRNRAYGAYALRREYPRNLGKALGIGLLLIGFSLVLPQLLKAVSGLVPVAPPTEVVIELGPPPDVEGLTPPPPPPPAPTPPPPPRSLQRFVPPVVLEDEKAPEDEPQAAVDKLLNNPEDIGNRDVKVDEEAPPTITPNDLPFVEPAVQKPQDDETMDLVTVQKPPTFPGGERDLMKFLYENIKYPALARENNIQGNVVLTFVVDKDGTVRDVQTLKDIGGGCGKEAVRVVQSMPKWLPGEASGHAVKVRYTLPVRFKLE